MKISNDIKAVIGIINSRINDHQATNQQRLVSVTYEIKKKQPNWNLITLYLTDYQKHVKVIDELLFVTRQIESFATYRIKRKRKK